MNRLCSAAALLALAVPLAAQSDPQTFVLAVAAPTELRYAGSTESSEALTFSDLLYGVRYASRGLLVEALYGRAASLNPTGGLSPGGPPFVDVPVDASRTLEASDVRARLEVPFELSRDWAVPVQVSVLWKRVRSVEVRPGDPALLDRPFDPEFSAQALRLGGGLAWQNERAGAWAVGLVGFASRDFGSTGLAYGTEAGARVGFPIYGQALTVGYAFRLDGYDFGRLDFAGEASSDLADYYALQHAITLGLRL